MASSKEKRKGHFWETVGEMIIVFLWLSAFALFELILWWSVLSTVPR